MNAFRRYGANFKNPDFVNDEKKLVQFRILYTKNFQPLTEKQYDLWELGKLQIYQRIVSIKMWKKGKQLSARQIQNFLHPTSIYND